jgi:hypothetical protein
MHDAAAEQDTAVSSPVARPAPVPASIDHPAPFQCSAKGRLTPFAVKYPTAVQARVRGQEMLNRLALADPLGSTVD